MYSLFEFLDAIEEKKLKKNNLRRSFSKNIQKRHSIRTLRIGSRLSICLDCSNAK